MEKQATTRTQQRIVSRTLTQLHTFDRGWKATILGLFLVIGQLAL